VTLTFDLRPNTMYSVVCDEWTRGGLLASLEIVVSAILVFYRADGQTDRHKHRDAAKRLTLATVVGVSNYHTTKLQ